MNRQSGWWAPYFFITPFVILFVIFMIYPLLYSVVLALQQTRGASRAEFVGLSNFVFLFGDELFWKAVRNTFYFAAGSVFLQLPCALGLAILMNRPDLKGRAFFRLIFFSPSLVGLVFVGVIFALIFEKRTGLINVLLFDATRAIAGWLHLPQAFIFDPDFPWLQEYAMPALIIAALWMYTGFNMIYFLAAHCRTSAVNLLEAAMVDGASAWDRFIHVTTPRDPPRGRVRVAALADRQLPTLRAAAICCWAGAGRTTRG